MTLDRRIKETRTSIGMSQKELADRVDLTPSFISQLESNQISPSLSSFMQICDALGVNPTAILGEKRADEKWLIKKERVFSNPSPQQERPEKLRHHKRRHLIGNSDCS